MDYKEQARIWTKRLSTYHAPEAFSRVAQASSEVPGSRFFNDSRFNPLREAWAAGQFAQAIQRRRNAEVLVRLEEGEFPDFVLKIGDRELPFEVTETMRPERKRGTEYKDREKDPLLLTPYRPAEGEQEGPSWIGESVRKKHEKSYGPKPHLLVYANFSAIDLDPEAVAAACREWSTSLRSVWVIWQSPATAERPEGLCCLSLFDSEEFGPADRAWRPMVEPLAIAEPAAESAEDNQESTR